MPHRLIPLSTTLHNNPKQIQIDSPLQAKTPQTRIILDPHRRNLIAQRLALLIRRIRASTLTTPQEENPDDH